MDDLIAPCPAVADDLRQRYAEAAKVVHRSWMTTEFEPVGDGRSLPERIADACLAVRDTELETARASLERLREYTVHRRTCAHNVARPCDCGLAALADEST